MKVIIDLIEAIREEINDQGDFELLVMLLQENENKEMISIGEKSVSRVGLVNDQLAFFIDNDKRKVLVEPVLNMCQGLSNKEMMLELVVVVSNQSFELIGFGKSEEDKKFVLFIEAKSS